VPNNTIYLRPDSSHPEYDVIVVGAGHAGCEAALADARLGCRTLLLTMHLDNVALMPCNPSIGGPAKGQLVREIDALGGEMARCIDKTSLHIRMLNTGKGPAAQAPRAQADKRAYGQAMKQTLETQPYLDVKQAMVEQLLVEEGRVLGVLTQTGAVYTGRTVVVTTGTSLNGRIIVGDLAYTGGRAGEMAATGLSKSLRQLGFILGRLKTGTPPRIDARTVDFDQTTVILPSPTPLYFSYEPPAPCTSTGGFSPYPNPCSTTWRPQLPCYLVHTGARTHQIIRDNLHRAPLFSGVIEGIGPRYCPSIEDKIVRFADKESHGLFLEPEGWATTEMYVQGANTSLPEDVQLAMLRSIPALARVEMTRVGYAIEYDYLPPHQTKASLESKAVGGLFFAGQINGTSGYEEAAAQGLMAGINAARLVRGEPPLVLRRDQAYIGVLIDDLVTREISEPYRMFTSRAEYRLLLRADNADLRLASIGQEVGLISAERYAAVREKRRKVNAELERLNHTRVRDNDRTVSALEYLRRPDVAYAQIAHLAPSEERLASEDIEQIEIEAKYAGYIEKAQVEAERQLRMEEREIPPGFDYAAILPLRHEARQALQRFAPRTVGQAARLSGVTPADIALLMVHLRRIAIPSDASDGRQSAVAGAWR